MKCALASRNISLKTTLLVAIFLYFYSLYFYSSNFVAFGNSNWKRKGKSFARFLLSLALSQFFISIDPDFLTLFPLVSKHLAQAERVFKRPGHGSQDSGNAWVFTKSRFVLLKESVAANGDRLCHQHADRAISPIDKQHSDTDEH